MVPAIVFSNSDDNKKKKDSNGKQCLMPGLSKCFTYILIQSLQQRYGGR